MLKNPPQSGDDAAFRGPVPPLPSDATRPLWSVMIPTYNCAHYLEETLQSVLQQDPGPEAMQIMVVDDHSTKDDSERVVRTLAGPRVEFIRQPRNLGVVGNLNDCLQRTRGQLVHLLHGDDLVRPGFYQQMSQVFTDNPQIGAAFCRHIYIDSAGTWQSLTPPNPPISGVLADAPRFLGSEQRIMTPSIVARRTTYEALGGFDRRLHVAEDWEMWMRIACNFPVYYLRDPLACYRIHQQSNTGRNISNGQNLDDSRLAIEMFTRYMDPRKAAEVRRAAGRVYSNSAMKTAYRLCSQGDYEGMKAQMTVAWKLHKRPVTLAHMARLTSRSLLKRLGGLFCNSSRQAISS